MKKQIPSKADCPTQNSLKNFAVNMAAEKSPEQIEITLSPLQKNHTNNQTTPTLKSCSFL